MRKKEFKLNQKQKKWSQTVKTKSTNTDNLIRSVNHYLKDYYNRFGENSKEYKRVYSMAIDFISDKSMYRKGYDFTESVPSNEPLQLTRSEKKWQNENDRKLLTSLRNAQLSYGSALTQLQKYIQARKEVNKKGINMSTEDVISTEYFFNLHQSEIYEKAKEFDDENVDKIDEKYKTAGQLLTIYNTSNDYVEKLKIMRELTNRSEKVKSGLAKESDNTEIMTDELKKVFGYTIM